MIRKPYVRILLILFFFVGCSKSPPPKVVLPERAAEIRLGQSQKQDILNIFGLPHEIMQQELNNVGEVEYWIYYKGRGKSKTYVIIPFPIADVGSYTLWGGATPQVSPEKDEQIAVAVAFDVNGIVVDVSRSNGGAEHETHP